MGAWGAGGATGSASTDVTSELVRTPPVCHRERKFDCARRIGDGSLLLKEKAGDSRLSCERLNQQRRSRGSLK